MRVHFEPLVLLSRRSSRRELLTLQVVDGCSTKGKGPTLKALKALRKLFPGGCVVNVACLILRATRRGANDDIFHIPGRRILIERDMVVAGVKFVGVKKQALMRIGSLAIVERGKILRR